MCFVCMGARETVDVWMDKSIAQTGLRATCLKGSMLVGLAVSTHVTSRLTDIYDDIGTKTSVISILQAKQPPRELRGNVCSSGYSSESNTLSFRSFHLSVCPPSTIALSHHHGMQCSRPGVSHQHTLARTKEANQARSTEGGREGGRERGRTHRPPPDSKTASDRPTSSNPD